MLIEAALASDRRCYRRGKMPAFDLGSTVLFNPKAGPDDFAFFALITPADRTEGEVWEGVRALPAEKGVRQYQIRSRQDGRERHASEGQLRPAL
jgi:hypothetical protein